MVNYYHRQIKLWGQDIQDSLQNKSIAIIGAGGLGSSIAIALSGSGIGTINIVDFDNIEIHNIHRQIAFVVGDEGLYKADVLTSLLKKRNPMIESNSHVMSFDEYQKNSIKVDLIIDATDNLTSRSQIDIYAKANNIPWIYGSVEAFNGHVCFFDNASFNDSFKVIDKTPAGIAAPIVMQVASFQANLALRFLTGLSIKKDKLYYMFYNDNGEFITQSFGVKS